MSLSSKGSLELDVLNFRVAETLRWRMHREQGPARNQEKISVRSLDDHANVGRIRQHQVSAALDMLCISVPHVESGHDYNAGLTVVQVQYQCQHRAQPMQHVYRTNTAIQRNGVTVVYP